MSYKKSEPKENKSGLIAKKNKSMNIALFGGAFDPPHLGHKIVADSLIKNQIVDEVWFVPVFKHPWADRYSKHQFAAYDQRVAMLELTISAQLDKQYGLQLSNQQKIAHFKSISFTYDTLEYFSQKNPEHIFSWLMGSEYLNRFDDFLVVHPLLTKYHFYIYPRAGYELNEELKKPNMEFLYHMPEITASSTQIKENIKAKKKYDDLVLPEIKKFIEVNQLYQ
jgi:nicotinate-nucleotide adenylyltransferase